MSLRPPPRRPFLRAGFVLTLLAVQLYAAEPKYLAGAVDPGALLVPPASAGSEESRWELDLVHRVHAGARPEQIARARAESKLSIFHFAPVIGDWLVPGKFPRTEALFVAIDAEAKPVTAAAKKRWQRIRPYHADPVLIPDAIEHEDRTDYSYPSGHATRGMLFALVLAELFPEKREALLEKGRESGWLRVIGGVHYPSDIFAGRVIGQAVAKELLRSEKFRIDLAAARAELAARPELAVSR